MTAVVRNQDEHGDGLLRVISNDPHRLTSIFFMEKRDKEQSEAEKSFMG